jgi:hypothetical protein
MKGTNMPYHLRWRPARAATLIAAIALALSGLAASSASAAAVQPERLGEKKVCLEAGKPTSHGGYNSDRTQKCNDGEWVDVPPPTPRQGQNLPTSPGSSQPGGLPSAP